MITERDLQAAIAECEGERNPNASTCMKLAAFYTIKEHLFPEAAQKPAESTRLPGGYSYGSDPQKPPESLPEGLEGTEFAEASRGVPVEDFFSIMDELMATLQIVQPRLYAGVMRKLTGWD